MRVIRRFLIVLLLTPQFLVAQQVATVYVGMSDVRRKPSMGDEVIAVLIKGQTVTVLERVGTWARISSGKTRGWIRASTLTTNPVSSTPSRSSIVGA